MDKQQMEAWVLRNCKFAAFNAPNKGDRIVLPSSPSDYFLVLDRPEQGRDARGQPFWHARVKDVEGREQFLSSDRVPNWSHFKGRNYPWHDQEIEQSRWNKQQQEQKDVIAGFENKYRFPDGQPLRKNPGRPMILAVSDATGEIGVFKDERVQVQDIDYQKEMVNVVPIGEGLADLAGWFPAAEVIRGAKPAMNPVVLREPVTLPTGQRITAEDLMHLTPGLNRMAVEGKVSLTVQVYLNYRSESGTEGGRGVSTFLAEMTRRGLVGSPEEIQAITGYRANNTPQQFDENGKPSNLFGSWQGDVLISPRIPKEVRAEIANVAPKSQIQERKDGSILVQSNPLYKQMVSLGVLSAR